LVLLDGKGDRDDDPRNEGDGVKYQRRMSPMDDLYQRRMSPMDDLSDEVPF
jgi:hypothetical protein